MAGSEAGSAAPGMTPGSSKKTGKKVTGTPRTRRAMNLVLVREMTQEEVWLAFGSNPSAVGLVVLADETAGLKTEQDVAKWMEKANYEGELYVAAFRRGTGKQAGTNERMRRRRFKPDPKFVVE